ncbi:hypothetical protein WEH80_37985 [Actinomycetes bacterium KLBMP 9759]
MSNAESDGPRLRSQARLSLAFSPVFPPATKEIPLDSTNGTVVPDGEDREPQPTSGWVEAVVRMMTAAACHWPASAFVRMLLLIIVVGIASSGIAIAVVSVRG